LAVTEFSGLLRDAGYSVATVSPLDLPSAVPARGTLLAVPSLESLPLDTFTAVVAHLGAGGSLMAGDGSGSISLESVMLQGAAPPDGRTP